jgi:hypothetical protein
MRVGKIALVIVRFVCPSFQHDGLCTCAGQLLSLAKEYQAIIVCKDYWQTVNGTAGLVVDLTAAAQFALDRLT